jgi:hypothetical protein
MDQIQCHEDQALKMYNMRIMNAAPSSLDSQLVGRMISCPKLFAGIEEHWGGGLSQVYNY